MLLQAIKECARSRVFSAECGASLKPCRVASAELNVYPYIIPGLKGLKGTGGLVSIVSIRLKCESASRLSLLGAFSMIIKSSRTFG